MTARDARRWGRRRDRFELGPLLQPLFEEQRSRSAVQAPCAITDKTMAFACSPGAAVFIHPSQG